MALVVQKYGGSSVGNADRIIRVAQRIVATRRAGNDVVVVVSAMGDTTDGLVDLAAQVTSTPSPREMDMLLSSGECVSSALLAMAILDLGVEACSLSGWQAGVRTTSAHGTARIVDVLPTRIRHELDRGAIVLVAGFQGLCLDNSDVTTLGRGGSDTTAVALAAALDADSCEIYTDVDGVYTADPRTVPNARLLARVSYEEMLELAAGGAKVLMLRCVEYARRNGVTLHVRSSYRTNPGTTVFGSMEEATMEQPLITGVAHDHSWAKVVVSGVPDHRGGPARIFRVLADAQVELDMVIQNVSRQGTGHTDITFTLHPDDGPTAMAILRTCQVAIGFEQVLYDERVGKVSLVGAGMRAHKGVVAIFCEALTAAGVDVEIISTSEVRISAVCEETDVNTAVRALHDAFELGSEKEAVSYAGSGL